MRFLIIGASGFVGRNVLAHVSALGFEAVGTQAKQCQTDLVRFNLLHDRIADCVGRSFLEREGRIVVIICAAVSNIDQCLLDREVSRRINVEQTIQLIEDVRPFNAKVVYLSSCFVFDGAHGYYNEEHPVAPINEYGRHKVEVEQYLQANVPGAFIARLEKIVSDDPYDGQIFSQWHRRFQSSEPIVCIEGSLLSPTWVKDVAQAFVVACQQDLAGIYHVSNSEFFYRDELARQFCYAAGKAPNVISRSLASFAFADKRALKCYLDGSKFIRVSGLRFTPMSQVFRGFLRNALVR